MNNNSRLLISEFKPMINREISRIRFKPINKPFLTYDKPMRFRNYFKRNDIPNLQVAWRQPGKRWILGNGSTPVIGALLGAL